MEMHPDNRPEESVDETKPQKHASGTPTHIRVLAFIGAVAVLALSIAYAWSIATGGIFWF